MAEAIFNSLTNKARASSAGTMPAENIDPLTIQALEEIGISAERQAPKKITDEMLQKADLIISFGCLIPSMFSQEKFLEWEIKDPKTIEEFRAVRNELAKKIKALLKNKVLYD